MTVIAICEYSVEYVPPSR